MVSHCRSYLPAKEIANNVPQGTRAEARVAMITTRLMAKDSFVTTLIRTDMAAARLAHALKEAGAIVGIARDVDIRGPRKSVRLVQAESLQNTESGPDRAVTAIVLLDSQPKTVVAMPIEPSRFEVE